jgi:hypothetical protein
VHVPLVAAGPHAERFADVRSLADLPRRLGEVAGLASHPWTEHAAAVSQFDPMGDAEHPKIQALFDEWSDVPREQLLRRLATPFTAVSDGGFKLVLEGEQELLYDLGADPLELDPVSAERVPADVLGRLRSHVSSGARGAGEVTTAEPSAAELADIEDRMRLLGYL